jgi:hypothetical protein
MKAVLAVDCMIHGETGLFKTFHNERGDLLVVFDQLVSAFNAPHM